MFSRAEALHAHGHTRDACRLAQKLAEELLSSPPDLLAETANLPSLKGTKNIRNKSVTTFNRVLMFYQANLDSNEIVNYI